MTKTKLNKTIINNSDSDNSDEASSNNSVNYDETTSNDTNNSDETKSNDSDNSGDSDETVSNDDGSVIELINNFKKSLKDIMSNDNITDIVYGHIENLTEYLATVTNSSLKNTLKSELIEYAKKCNCPKLIELINDNFCVEYELYCSDRHGQIYTVELSDLLIMTEDLWYEREINNVRYYPDELNLKHVRNFYKNKVEGISDKNYMDIVLIIHNYFYGMA